MSIEEKLEELRQEWIEHPEKRDVITVRAKLLKTVQETGVKFVPWYHKNEKKEVTVDEAIEALS